MKMILTVKVEWDVDDLSDYEAETLEEAVKNQRQWIEDGTADIYDMLDGCEIVSLEGVK